MLLSAVCLITGVLALLLVRRHRKLKSLVGLYGPPPSSYLAGHFKHMFGLHGIDFQLEVLRKYGPTVGMTGVMGEPFVLTFDPGFIHTVLVRERSKFERNEGGTFCLTQFLRYNIFANVSSNISLPSLSTDTSLTVLPVFTDVAKQACRAIDQSLSTEVNDVFQWSTAAALEFIGEAGLGYSFGSFSGETNEYSVQVLKATKLQNDQAEQILRKRKDLLERGVDLESVTGRGKDILTQLSNKGWTGSVLIFAGHETSSSVIARILDVVAHDTNIQDKMREELLENKDKDTLELPYLDAVVKETCEEDTVVPLIYPISTPSGTTTNLPVKKGTRLALSVVFSNRDESVWGKRASEFWPERWLETEQQQTHSHLQGIYSSTWRRMTFGLGQYSCIGFKFAVMEIKVMTSQLLKSFRFEPSGEDYAWEVSRTHTIPNEQTLLTWTKERWSSKSVPCQGEKRTDKSP
ncbi:cytochrome P450 domain-containing protein [Rhizoctonia solani AG-1 IA]|uniref:Cytochrome P450 domain-containing protein n=1 Tax=Thanatephorus cucumeris (strain AG1-IA) TaxID=983506 RepID=L8WWX0_THACA|nr:cytochrome P450 domain-containing protein [Rhizoctonia solani AG-1 IA]